MAEDEHKSASGSPPPKPGPMPSPVTMSLRGAPGGRIRVGVSRDGTYGEDNRGTVANLVVILLNEWGEGWGPPRAPEGPEDGADIIADGPRGRLRLQITRVPQVEEHWQRLSVDGHTERTVTPDDLADDMITAIRKKAAHYSPEVLATTMLVLDGQNAFGFDLPPVLHSFTKRHLKEAQESGFGDVFLLGTVRFINLLVPQLDSTWFGVA